MLQSNPIVRHMYRMGYNGYEDMYEYWTENKQEVIDDYLLKHDDPHYNVHLFELILQIRWNSAVGLLYRLELDLHMLHNPHTTIDLNDVTRPKGSSRMSILEYSQETLPVEEITDKADLRGILVNSKHIHNVIIRDVNFDFASFSFVEMVNVTFINCSFEFTSFYKANLINCKFDEECVFYSNDFSKSLIISDFSCEIVNPNIIKMETPILSQSRFARNIRHHNFTTILSESFVNNCDSEIAEQNYNKQRGVLDILDDYLFN